LRLIAAMLAFGAEGFHLSILADQTALWWGYGAFFLAVSAAQGLLGASLLFAEPPRWLATGGIALCIGLAAIWAVTRLGGIPGVWTFVPLPIQAIDLTATLLELGLAAVLFPLGRSTVSGEPWNKTCVERAGRQRATAWRR
jgi:hypothetical protein